MGTRPDRYKTTDLPNATWRIWCAAKHLIPEEGKEEPNVRFDCHGPREFETENLTIPLVGLTPTLRGAWTMRAALVIACIVLPQSVCGPCCAEVTRDDAARILTEAGLPVRDPQPGSDVTPPSELVAYTFWDEHDRAVFVHLDPQGRLAGWTVRGAREETADLEARLTEEDCSAIARHAASVAVGPGADALTWATVAEADTLYRFRAKGPALGDPPRFGLSPRCDVTVERDGGLVRFYAQRTPSTTEPLPVAVTAEEALRLAREGIGILDASVFAEGPNAEGVLWQCGDSVYWLVDLVRPSVREDMRGRLVGVQIKVDARTGEILEADEYRGAVAEPEAANLGGLDDDRATLVLGGLLLVAAALSFTVWRRWRG